MIEWLATGGAALALAGGSLRYTWWRRPLAGIPVLMYHLISDDLSQTSLPKLRVSPARFAAQLDLLAHLGYTTLTLAQARGVRPNGRQVVLTFDDGFRNFFTHAWPQLAERGMTATVFVVSGELDGANTWDQPKGEPAEPLLSRAELLELDRAGVEIGGHSHSHRGLAGLDDRGLLLETTGCQKALSDTLGRPVRTFSYPYGHVDERARDAVRRAGFDVACTTRPGMLASGGDALAIPRIIVKRSDDLLDFRLKLKRAKSRL
ncbi:MAG: polysaccharide deacetylase family protein [Deltaproteobacteria bacterium]|nr:polysaccharide deacetylase family protein [Deltaproteobacteria bacterium]